MHYLTTVKILMMMMMHCFHSSCTSILEMQCKVQSCFKVDGSQSVIVTFFCQFSAFFFSKPSTDKSEWHFFFKSITFCLSVLFGDQTREAPAAFCACSLCGDTAVYGFAEVVTAKGRNQWHAAKWKGRELWRTEKNRAQWWCDGRGAG